MIRCFIAIAFEDRVKKDIDAVQKHLKRNRSPVRWTKTENIHLTLKFIGDVEQALMKQLQDTLSSVRSPHFEICLSGLGTFGRAEMPSIFWIGLEKSDPLNQLVESIENLLSAGGIPRETRAFSPHITIGRNRRRIEKSTFKAEMERYADRRISQMNVDCFHLIQSRLTPAGPVYNTIQSYPLVKR